MNRSLLPIAFVLLFSRCSRDNSVAPALPVPHVGQKTLIQAFDPSGAALVNQQGVRVGRYYDFSPYDSLVITFTGQRVSESPAPVPLKIKIGPSYYVYGSLQNQKQDLSFHVLPSLLAKPGLAAVIFFAADSASSFLLMNLNVVGWYTY